MASAVTPTPAGVVSMANPLAACEADTDSQVRSLSSSTLPRSNATPNDWTSGLSEANYANEFSKTLLPWLESNRGTLPLPQQIAEMFRATGEALDEKMARRMYGNETTPSTEIESKRQHDDANGGDDPNPDDNDEVPWSNSIMQGKERILALRKRSHRMVKLVPVEDQAGAERCDDGSIIIRDETMLLDRFHARCPGLFKVFMTFNDLNFVLFLLSALPNLPAAPFAVLAITGFSAAFFGDGSEGLTNATNSTGLAWNATNNHSASWGRKMERPWPLAWEQASLVLVGVFLVSGMWQNIGVLVLQTSPSMARRLLALHWPTLAIKVFFGWSYCIVAIIMQPHPVHILWLLFVHAVFPIVRFFEDANAVFVHLRFHPHWFAKFVGKDDADGRKSNSRYMAFIIFMGVLGVATDVVRHYLVLSFGQDFRLINIPNPLSSDGKSIVFGARDLASMLYSGSILFLAQSIWTAATRKALRETFVNTTRYEIKAGVSRRSTQVRLSSGRQKRGISLQDWKSQKYLGHGTGVPN